MDLSRGLIFISTLCLLAALGSVADCQLPDSPGLFPGDVVRVRIWREPDLSGDFPVDDMGTVIFPKLGPTRVAGLSTDSLKHHLLASYQVYLRNASIDVTVLRRVNISGAVRNPGLYPVDPTMTVADAVALAGGASPDGDRRRAELLRGDQRMHLDLGDRRRLIELSLRSGDQVFVPEKPWLSRNQGVMAASVSALATILVALVLR